MRKSCPDARSSPRSLPDAPLRDPPMTGNREPKTDEHALARGGERRRAGYPARAAGEDTRRLSSGISIQRKRSTMEEQVKKPQPKPVETPFFVRFLEQQELLAVQTGVKAGRTLKYPSDNDE